jgi:uncharacterized protein
MSYLDTSVLVAALTTETATNTVQRWMREQSDGSLVISDWTLTETSSALSIKLRTGQIDQEYRADALSTLKRMVSDSLVVKPVTVIHFRQASVFAEQHDLGLRAGDALQLAIAYDLGETVVTLDRTMATAGSRLGIRTLVPSQ